MGAQSIGDDFLVELDEPLTAPATISVDVPEGEAERASLFLAYFDDSTGKWVPMPGALVNDRIVVETIHFSWWKVWKWNWSAWTAALKSALSLEVTEWIQGFQVLTGECEKKGNTVSVDDAAGSGILEGCIDSETGTAAKVRVLNEKTFIVEVVSSNDPEKSTLLNSGDSLNLTVDTTLVPPVQVTAQISQQAGYRLVAELILRLLPAKEIFAVKSLAFEAIASLADALAVIPEAIEASDALAAGNRAVAVDKIYAVLTSERTGETVAKWAIKFGQDHGINTLTKWSSGTVSKALIAVASVDVIVTVTDYISNYFLNNTTFVRFTWTGPTPPPPTTPPPTTPPANLCSDTAHSGRPQSGSLEEDRFLEALTHLQRVEQSFTASTGTTITIGVFPDPYYRSVNFFVSPLQQVLDPTQDDGLPNRMQTFREAAAAIFALVASQGVCVGDLYGYWHTAASNTAHYDDLAWQWLGTQ